LAKAIYIVFVHVDGDVVRGMAACQPVVLVCVLCGGRMETVDTNNESRAVAIVKNRIATPTDQVCMKLYDP
jgi:hypothetical protein